MVIGGALPREPVPDPPGLKLAVASIPRRPLIVDAERLLVASSNVVSFGAVPIEAVRTTFVTLQNVSDKRRVASRHTRGLGHRRSRGGARRVSFLWLDTPIAGVRPDPKVAVRAHGSTCALG